MATITGTALDDSLVGVEGQADVLIGLAGNDTLTGSAPVVEPIIRVSTTAAGGPVGGGLAPDLSADGRYVVFQGYAIDLVAGDTNLASDIFLKDTLTGAISRLSTDAWGKNSWNPAVSAEGRYVAFESYASDLVVGDTNLTGDIFLKDTLTGTISRVNTTANGDEAAGGDSMHAAVSADGRYVAFESRASNLVAGDTNGVRDIFVKDTVTGSISRVNTNAAGDQTIWGEESWNPALSADGRYVAFESWASNLVAGDSNGYADIFVKDTLTGRIARVNTTATGAQATGGASFASALSADERYVVFESEASNLVAGDTNTMRDIFVKDTVTGFVTRVSTSAAGVQADGNSFGAAVSADGRYVVFASDASNLVAGDTNTMDDVFVKDTLTGAIARLSMSAAGDQAPLGQGSWKAAISADGRYVAFHSDASNLVADDTNGVPDVFRVLNPLLDGDLLHGGAGDDTYVIAMANDRVMEAPDEGTDTVRASISYTLPDNVEDLVLTGNGAFKGTGNGLDNVLTGNSGVNTLSGGAGNDILTGNGSPFEPIIRVNTTAAGAQATGGGSFAPALSGDGRYVVFVSDASNLVADDSNWSPDIFLKDTLTGAITRVAELGNWHLAISSDGRYVVFDSVANNLVAGDTDWSSDLFRKDTLTGVITHVAEGGSLDPAMSADGRYVVFDSVLRNLVAGDTNGATDIFMKDMTTGVIARVSTNASGVQAQANYSLAPAISADGRYVVFESDARNLVAGDVNGLSDVFLKDTETGTITRVSTNASGVEAAGGGSFRPAISADGRYVAFMSYATNLVAGDTNKAGDIFLKDTLTGAIIRVSTDARGAEAAGGLSFSPTVSAEGRYVAFESYANNLVAGDTNGSLDVFVKDIRTGMIARVSAAADGGQATGAHSVTLAPTISADGRYVVFASDASNLVGDDTNRVSDVFRVLNPLLDGDLLQGGTGNDTYFVAVPNDRVIERVNEGVDVVRTRISYTLPANVENLVLEGDAVVRGVGNVLANSLTGNGASNFLNGGAGADTMAGGGANDTYVVDNNADVVTELAGNGTDTILASVSLVLPNNVENLRLTGATGTESINGTGNEQANLIKGNAGDNVIEGGAGDDVMDGGAGADIASYATAGAGVTVNLGLTTPQATGGAGSDTLLNFEHLLGSRFADTLIGDAGDNVLKGGGGKDLLTGGGGADAFVLNSPRGPDTITDFLSGTDKLRLNMTGLRVGDGDTLVENAVVASRGGFDAGAELVIITTQIANGIGPIRAAQAIGSATTAYAAGQTSLFAVNNGTDTGVFLFTSAGADAQVSATELTLLGTLSGTSTTSLADYVFVA